MWTRRRSLLSDLTWVWVWVGLCIFAGCGRHENMWWHTITTLLSDVIWFWLSFLNVVLLYHPWLSWLTRGWVCFMIFVEEKHYCKNYIQQTPTLLLAVIGSSPYANKMQTNNNISHFHCRRYNLTQRWHHHGLLSTTCLFLHFVILYYIWFGELYSRESFLTSVKTDKHRPTDRQRNTTSSDKTLLP